MGPLPRILDMGQCNDAYSAITVAVALAEAYAIGPTTTVEADLKAML